jgi:hypothetical protein
VVSGHCMGGGKDLTLGSGRTVVLLRRSLLRTVQAARRRTRLRQAARAAHEEVSCRLEDSARLGQRRILNPPCAARRPCSVFVLQLLIRSDT